MIRLLIAAPSAVVRAGLEAWAASNPELRVVGSSPDLAEAADLEPDVIVAALPLGEVPAIAEGGTVPLVLLTNDPRPVWTVEALHRGVRSLLRRDALPAEIQAAVEAAANGLATLDPHDLEALLASAAPVTTQGEDDVTPLTLREREVLEMMAEGAANKVIAWRLGISEHTVKFHVASILAKLNASSRTEAVTIGIRKGLVLV